MAITPKKNKPLDDTTAPTGGRTFNKPVTAPTGGRTFNKSGNPASAPVAAPISASPNSGLQFAVDAQKKATTKQLPPLIGIGQFLLKGLMTSGAGGVAVLDEALNRKSQPVTAAAKNIKGLWGPTDIFAPGELEKVKFGEDVARDTLGISDKMNYTPKGVVDIAVNTLASLNPLASVGFNLLGGRKLYNAAAARGADNEEAPGQIPYGTNRFWAGLGIDVVSDPLTYGTLGLSIPFRAAISAARGAATGAKLARGLEVTAKLAPKVDGVTPEIANQIPLGLSKRLGEQRLQNVRNRIVANDPKNAEVITKAESTLANNLYKTTRVPDSRTAGQYAVDVAVSAIDAGKKAVVNDYMSRYSAKFLADYAKRDVTRTGAAVLKVGKDAETGGFGVFTGNKVRVAQTETKEQAQAAVKQMKQGNLEEIPFVPVATIQGVRQAVDGNDESIVIPTATGEEVTIERMVPHQADNDKVYVYDGENVSEFSSIEDANEWVRISGEPALVTELTPVVSGKSGSYQVRVNDSITRFKTKKEATAYAEAVRTGQAPSPARTTAGGTPIIDTAPRAVNVTKALEAPTPKEASALRQVLEGIDNLSKKVSGWKPLVNQNVANQIKQVVGNTQARLDVLLVKMKPGQLSIIKEFIERDLSAKEFFALLRDSGADGKILADSIRTIPVSTVKGQKLFGELLDLAKGDFFKISQVADGVEGSVLEAQIIKQLKTRFYDRAQQLKTRVVLPAFEPEGQYQAILAVAGQKVADQIKATGYLTNKNAATNAKFQNILEEISSGSSEVSYQGYDDLIEGLRRGDEISSDVLDEIINLIDPDGAMKSAVVQASAEPAGVYLTRLLTRQGGVDTIYEAERRLAMASDPKMLAKHSGLAYEADLAALIERGVGNDAETLAQLPLATTRQSAARSFEANYSVAVQTDAMDSAGRAIMGDPKKAGEAGRASYVASILEEAEGGTRFSTLGDEIYSTGAAYSDGSRAAFAKQLTQSDESKIIASLLGKLGYRQGEKLKASKLSGEAAEAITGEQKLAYLIERLSAVKDGMTGLGFRFTRTKPRNDPEFQKAYNLELQRAKKTKTTPNFSALSLKHTAYLPMGDILNILSQNGKVSALVDAYLPVGKNVNYKTQTMDWISLGDAARRVLEMDAAGEAFDMNEIAIRLIKRGETRGTPSAATIEKFKGFANELAETLTEPGVVAQLKAVHLDNAASIVKDFAEKADTYSKNLFDIMDSAWFAMHATNNLSEAARMQAVRMFFRKFVIASDVMRLEGGPIAEAMFRASAMLFADGGKVLPEGVVAKGLTKTQKDFYNLLRQDELRMFREALTKFYRYADMPSAPIGREGMPKPKAAAQNRSQEQLDVTMELYAKHMDELAKISNSNDPQLIKAWDKDMKRIQSQLDKARDSAWKNWLPTSHWHPVDGWVPTEQFNHARALKSAEQVHVGYVAGKRGVVDREMLMADTVPVIPAFRVLSRAEKAKFLKRYRVEKTAALIKNARSIADDIAKNVADDVQLGALDVEGLNGSDKMMIAMQNMQARAQKEIGEIRIATASATYKTKLPESNVEFNTLYRSLLDVNTPVFASDRAAVRLRLMGERWAATTRGTSEQMMVLRGNENMASVQSRDFTAALDDLTRITSQATQRDVADAWDSIRSGLEMADDASPLSVSFRDKLEPFINITLRNSANSVLTQNGMDGASLGKALSRYGIDEKIGFPSIADLTDKTPDELVSSFYNSLPLGSLPENITPGTIDAEKWFAARNKFQESGVPPALAISRMFSAIQQLKAEQGTAYDLVAQFGWEAHFKNMADAQRAGWVQIDAVGSDSIARFLPDAMGGNLFHPQVAESIGRVFRQWNSVYEGKALHPFLRASMNFLGFIKFMQTQARPGHHVVNLLGDGSNAFIATPGSQLPSAGIYIAEGTNLSSRYTKLNFAAEYSKLGRDFEAKNRRLSGAFREIPGSKMPNPADMETGFQITLIKNGRPVTTKIDRDKFAFDLGQNGAFVPGTVQADIMNSANDMMLTGAGAGQKRALSQIWGKVARPGHELMKGISAGTSAYSNTIRGYTVARVAKSQSWSSYDEMMNAILKEVNLIHPTAQSLASSEKKWGRLLVTYYTWLRVAHNMLFDMAINRSGAILAIPKIQYNYAQMQGFDPESPAVPFKTQEGLPDYISTSVYGPTEKGPQGARVNRWPLILLDVLDFWKIYYDPSKPVDQNIFNMGGQFAANVVAPSLNILGQPAIRALGETPGGPRNLEEAAFDAFEKLGFAGLLTGLGAYTPYRYKRENTTNPLTEEDRKRTLGNWLKGSRSQDIERPINEKLGQSQLKSREKDYNKRVQLDNDKNIQLFIDDKMAEGFSKAEIIEMLKELGVE